eukprot:COSAG01_NODE_67363_length_267_cov_0.767857_1_plen_69_part_10
MQKILILGGAGFIGFHLSGRLAAEGHQIVVVDDFSRGRKDAELEALLSRPNVNVRADDLTDPKAFDAFG